MWDLIEEMLKTIAIILGIVLLFCFPAMWLWNWLMPYIFNLPTLTFSQMGGLLLLTYLFFHE